MPCGARTSDWRICSFGHQRSERHYQRHAAVQSRGYSTFGNPAREAALARQPAPVTRIFVDERIAWVPVRIRSLERTHEPLADRSRRRAARRLRLRRWTDGNPERPGNQSAQCVRGVSPRPAFVGWQGGRSRTTADDRAWRQGFCARDQWQATRDLTLTLGVRADITRCDPEEPRIELYDVATNKVRVGGGLGAHGRGWEGTVHFAPRLGAAYRIGDKWVVRGGFGVSTDPFSLARLFRTNYPSLVAMDIVSANSFGFVGKTKMASRRFQFRRLAMGSSTFRATSSPAPGRIQPGIYTELQRDRAA